MANLRYLKNRNRWWVRWHATCRKTHFTFKGSRTFLEKSQALKFYAEIEEQEKLVRSGKVTPGQSLDDAVAEFFRHIKRYTKRTQDHYIMVMDLFLRSIPQSVIRLHQLESAHIQDYIYKKKDFGHKNRTINAHLTVLKSFCRYCSERYDLANPAKKIKLLTEDPPKSRYLTKEEYQKLLNIAPDLARNRIIFLANTGLRAAEFASLSFVNLDAKAITLTGKGRRRRTVPLNQSARDVLPHVQPASRKALQQQISKLAKKMNLQFGPNALRHYFATQLLLNGIPTAKVAKVMGNSVRVIEKHYAHILTADIDNVTSVLDKI